MSDTKSLEETKAAEHAEHHELPPDVAAIAMAAGAKGHTKSADVAMKLFENHDFNMEVDPAEEKRIIKKIDWFIIPLIAVNYIFFYVRSG